MESTYLLAVDLGVTNTVAVLRSPAGRSTPLVFDGDTLLPSGVLLDPSGAVLTGRDAIARSAEFPDRYEPAPRSRAADAVLRLGGTETTPADLLSGVLAAVGSAAAEVAGSIPDTVLTHPVLWRRSEEGVLRRAAAQAGFPNVTLLSEPIAAASVLPVPLGAHVVVVDVGARGFEASVVRHEDDGLRVLTVGGDTTIGGRRIDAAIAAHLAGTAGRQRRDAWRAIDRPQDPGQRQVQRAFWDDVRAAKEALASADRVPISVPGLSAKQTLTRADLERFARPLVDRVGRVTGRVLREAGLRPYDVDTLLVIGGAARLPMLAPALYLALGVEPVLVERPEIVMAVGALRHTAAHAGVSATRARPPVVVPAPRRAPSTGVPAAAARWARAATRGIRRPIGALPAPPKRAALTNSHEPVDSLPVLRERSGPAPAPASRYGWALILAPIIALLLVVAVLVLLQH
ncbi:Hsp70 family protein [Cryptosporangium phraense]|uniref:Hsp70 family protein n=1 Tax=Cryptosporangium phraense TaxID=2593070 RepID=UPI001479676F|nr:Hsp70 family protein [Cryptosporangium phraense]